MDYANIDINFFRIDFKIQGLVQLCFTRREDAVEYRRHDNIGVWTHCFVLWIYVVGSGTKRSELLNFNLTTNF